MTEAIMAKPEVSYQLSMTPQAHQALQQWRDAVMRYVVVMQVPDPNTLGDEWFAGACAIHRDVTEACQRYHDLVYGEKRAKGKAEG
jgi:hypothetical protein